MIGRFQAIAFDPISGSGSRVTSCQWMWSACPDADAELRKPERYLPSSLAKRFGVTELPPHIRISYSFGGILGWSRAHTQAHLHETFLVCYNHEPGFAEALEAALREGLVGETEIRRIVIESDFQADDALRRRLGPHWPRLIGATAATGAASGP